MYLDGKQERKEVCINYLRIVELLPISFDELLGENESAVLISAELLMDVFFKIYPFEKVKEEDFDAYLEICRLYKGSKRVYLSAKEKKAYFVVSKFFFKSSSFINGIFNDYKNTNKEGIEIYRICQYIKSSNRELDLDLDQIRELLLSLFTNVSGDTIKIDSLINFADQRLKIQILVGDFLNFCLKSIEEAFEFVRIKVNNVFERYSVENVLDFSQFKSLMLKHFLEEREMHYCMQYFTCLLK